jgi:hypothetical protein
MLIATTACLSTNVLRSITARRQPIRLLVATTNGISVLERPRGAGLGMFRNRCSTASTSSALLIEPTHGGLFAGVHHGACSTARMQARPGSAEPMGSRSSTSTRLEAWPAATVVVIYGHGAGIAVSQPRLWQHLGRTAGDRQGAGS